MKKRVFSTLLCSVLACSSVVGMTSCGGDKEKGDITKTINVQLYDAGYGHQWFEAVAKKFEQIYSNEGYKVVLKKHNTQINSGNVLPELAYGKDNIIDLYYANGINAGTIAKYCIQNNNGTNVAMDLSDVLSASAINENGQEESGAIKDKLVPGFLDTLTTDYTYAISQNDKYATFDKQVYMLPMFSSPNGFVVNKPLLEKAGLEVPKTTDELLNCVTVINQKRESGADGFENVYPLAWGGGNAWNYWRYIYDVWYAQYNGIDAYNTFVTLDGYENNFSEAWKLYENESWLDIYELMEVMLNTDNAPVDTLNVNADEAQCNLLIDNAVFMSTGVNLQNEMGAEFFEDMEKVEMIATPIISELGVKLALDGKGGEDEALCDKVLSAIVKGIEEGKDNAAIKSAVTLATVSDDQINAVRNAYNVYSDQGLGAGFVVSATTEKADICKLFLRFLASDYVTSFLSTNTYAISAYSKNYVYDVDKEVDPFYASALKFREGKTMVYRMENMINVRTLNDFTLFDPFDWEKDFAIKMAAGSMNAEKFYNNQLAAAKKACGVN